MARSGARRATSRAKPSAARRRTLTELSSRVGLVREYLADNVLSDLPERTREFLIGSCVLGRLSGTLCDTLLGLQGSESVLEELERGDASCLGTAIGHDFGQ